MARKTASKRAVSHNRPLSTDQNEPANFQLAVVNSCLCNEDVRLPHLPTPALLTPFYAKYKSTASLSTSPWECDYWCTRVAHVVLGRHSALPTIYRLRHECAGRLHVRIVYVRAASVHRQLQKAYPPLSRLREDARSDSESENSSNDDVVIVEQKNKSTNSLTAAAHSSPWTVLTGPYYLLINHSENPVFVNLDRVPQGRSVVLREGDVVSFLECAFDADGGVLDKISVTDVASGAGAKSGSVAVDTQAEECASAAVEHIQRLAKESLWRCVDAAQPPSCTPLTPHEVRVAHRTVAIRRCYQVPHVIREYMRWWHRHTTRLAERDRVRSAHVVAPPAEQTGDAFSWMVSGNHLVRAPSIANSDLTRVVPVCTKAEDVTDTSAATAPPALQKELYEDILHDPPVVTALRQWLKDTEGLEEVTDEVHSPLAARLVLDRAWLWRLVRSHQHQSTCHSLASSPVPHAALSPSPVKLEDKTIRARSTSSVTAKAQDKLDPASGPLLLIESPSAPSQSAPVNVEERFRITLPSEVENLITTGGAAPEAAPPATPQRRTSAVRAMLEELRRSQSKENHTSGPGTQDLHSSFLVKEQKGDTEVTPIAPGVHRRLRLDTDPISVYAKSDPCAATKPVSEERLQSPPPSICPSLLSGEMPSCVPAVRIRPAALPVYVFTRRSPSPDVYTRERNSFTFTHASSPTAMRHVNGSGVSGSVSGLSAAKQFVYYYDPDEHPNNDGGALKDASSALMKSSSPVSTKAMLLPCDSQVNSSTPGCELLWVDEAEGMEVVTPRASVTRKRGPAKKGSAKRKRPALETATSAIETKAACVDGTSAPEDKSTPMRTATPML